MPFLHIGSLTIYGKGRKTYQPPSDLLLTQYFKLDQNYTRSLAVAINCVVSYIIDDSKTLGRLQQTCKAYCKCEEEALKKQRKSFFMAHGLRGLMLNTMLADNWGLALYIPDWRSEESAWKKSIGVDRGAEFTEKQLVVRKTVINEAIKADACGFFRCGFQQVIDNEIVEGNNCDYLFAVPSFMQKPIISYADAMSIPFIQKKPRPPPLKGINKELFSHVYEQIFHKFPKVDEQLLILKKVIQDYVAKGAELSKVPILHLYVAHGRSEFIPLLLEMGSDVNLLDESSFTPLQIACQMFGKDPASISKNHKMRKARNEAIQMMGVRQTVIAGMGDRRNVPESVVQEAIDKILNNPNLKERLDKIVKQMAEMNMGNEFKHCIDLLVDVGANLTILTPKGLSALGVYSEQRKSTLQWCKTMTSRIYRNPEEAERRDAADAYIKKLLSFPGKVPTELDQEYVNYDPFHDSSEDDDELEDDY